MLTPVILIADKQTLFVEGLARIIREKLPYIDITGTSSVAELLEYLNSTRPQVIILNYQFIVDHFGKIRPALEQQNYPEIITICDEWTEEAKKTAASLGALGVLSKECGCDDVWRELERIINIKSANANTKATSAMHIPVAQDKTDALTCRQRKILQLLAGGLTNREISDRIGCAETTVKAHLNIAYKILGVKNRTQAMVVMAQVGPLSNAG